MTAPGIPTTARPRRGRSPSTPTCSPNCSVEPQVYGTQWQTDASGSLVLRTPIEDAATVDQRRADAGLGTLDEYIEELGALPE